MDPILNHAYIDLAAMQADLQARLAGIDELKAKIKAQHDFIEKAERYAGNPYPIRSDIPVPDRSPKTVQRIPYEGSKRWKIGNAVLVALDKAGRSMTTKQLMEVIDLTLLEPSTAPQNYLSNALSKDARFKSTDQGWAKNTDVLPPPEVEEAI